MKIFFSWSGTRSRYIANTLDWWLPHVLQPIAPFISTRDIPKGARGLSIIADNLEKTNIGIVCLTEENLDKPWILFEAGALSKLTTASYVCTFILDLDPSDIEPPLGQFQHTRYIQNDSLRSKAEVLDLARTINGALGDRALAPARLEEAFDTWWPKLEEKMAAMPNRRDDEKPAEKRSDESKLDEILTLLRERPERTAVQSASHPFRNPPQSNSDWARRVISNDFVSKLNMEMAAELQKIADAGGTISKALITPHIFTAMCISGYVMMVVGNHDEPMFGLTSTGQAFLDNYNAATL